MADSDSGIGCFCTRSCSCCKGSECCCPRCKGFCSNFMEFVKRKCFGLTLVTLGFALVIAAFVLIEDPDWNIAVVPYLCTFVSCALVSVTCKRGHYDRTRLVDVCRPQASRRPTGSDDFVEVMDSELSPLLSGPDRNGQVENLNLLVDYKPIKSPEDLFEPLPAILREQRSLRRNSQVVVQADVHQPVNAPASDEPVLGEPAPVSPISPVAESSWTASASDPHHSTTPADSGIALQSTGQSSTQSGSAGHVPRPPPPVPVSPMSPQQDPPSLFSS